MTSIVTLLLTSLSVRAADNALSPSNDEFSNAKPLSETVSSTPPEAGTTAGATTEAGEYGVPYAVCTVWYDWVGITDGANENFWTRPDYIIEVFTGSAVDGLTLISTSRVSGPVAVASFTQTAGVHYKIRVRPPTIGAAGPFHIAWANNRAPGAPEEDAAANR